MSNLSCFAPKKIRNRNRTISTPMISMTHSRIQWNDVTKTPHHQTFSFTLWFLVYSIKTNRHTWIRGENFVFFVLLPEVSIYSKYLYDLLNIVCDRSQVIAFFPKFCFPFEFLLLSLFVIRYHDHMTSFTAMPFFSIRINHWLGRLFIQPTGFDLEKVYWFLFTQ